MFSTVLFLVFIIFKAAASELDTENPVVYLVYRNNENKNYKVWKNKPLTIVIENGYPRYVWCRSRYAKTTNGLEFIPITEFSNEGIAKLSVNVTAEMSTSWACTVLQNYVPPGPKYPYKRKDYTAKDLFFNLHVRDAKAVILSANSRSLTYVTTDLSVNYDGEASYTYVEGEDLEISCKMAQDLDEPSTLRLEYYNASGILLFKTESRAKNPHLFRTVLKSDNNNFYLECIRATEYRENRYKTTFLKIKGELQAGTDQHVMILSVNGQELTTILNKDLPYDDHYIYRYILGDGVLNVTCRKKDNTLPGLLDFFIFNGEYVKQRLPAIWSASKAVISVNISTSNLKNKILICGINNSDALKPNARLVFLPDVLQHDIRIQGLAKNNVLYQYTNDENRWTIEYQYCVNETLNLTCVSNTGYQMRKQLDASCFEWKFKGKSYKSQAGYLPTYPPIKWSLQPFMKTLDATHNTTKLRCIYFPDGKSLSDLSSSVELIFRLKPELVSGESSKENDVLIYSLSSALAIVVCTILVISLILYKISSTQKLTLPTPRPDPASRYYENMLSVFAPINEREAEAMENHYEEIQ